MNDIENFEIRELLDASTFEKWCEHIKSTEASMYQRQMLKGKKTAPVMTALQEEWKQLKKLVI